MTLKHLVPQASLIPNDLDIGSPGVRRPRVRPASSPVAVSQAHNGTGSGGGAAPSLQQQVQQQRHDAGSPAARVPLQQNGSGGHGHGGPALRPPQHQSSGGGAYHPQRYGFPPLPYHVQPHLAQQQLFQQQPYGVAVLPPGPPGLLHQPGGGVQNLNGGGGGGGDAECSLPVFPSRPGHPICDFYQKTGHCKVGAVLRAALRLL